MQIRAQESPFDVATMVRCPPGGKLTFEAFHDWLDEDTWAEWVDGEVQVLLPTSFRHADLIRFLLSVLSFWTEARDLGVVLAAPFLMRLPPPVHNGREPDLLFVARAHFDRIRPTFVDGPADLVIEIVSPESSTRDWVEKRAEYERAGIPEYWIVDPILLEAAFHQLGADGVYHLVDPLDGIYVSATLAGLRLPVAWLWQEPLPRLDAALKELGFRG